MRTAPLPTSWWAVDGTLTGSREATKYLIFLPSAFRYRLLPTAREIVHQLLRRCLGEGVGTEEVLHLDIRKARAREPSGELLASELRRIKGHGEDHLVNDLVERLPPPIVSQDSAR